MSPNSRFGSGFRNTDDTDLPVKPVSRAEVVELMGDRQVTEVERLIRFDSAERAGRSRRAGGGRRPHRDTIALRGSWTDVVVDVVSCEDDLFDVRGVVLPGARIDLTGRDADYLRNCIANLWTRPTLTTQVTALGQFSFAGVTAGPAELAISCGGHLLLADLHIES